MGDERALMPDTSHHGAFGNDRFGKAAERFARFFGTPRFIVGQTILVAIWIILNAAAVSLRWDPYPFILLNLAFSTQAAYAAPLILLAQTRQADRDKVRDERHFRHIVRRMPTSSAPSRSTRARCWRRSRRWRRSSPPCSRRTPS